MSDVTDSYRPIGIDRKYRRSITTVDFVEAVTLKIIENEELTGRYNALLSERNELKRTVQAQAEQLEQAREFLTHLVRCWHEGCDTRDEVRSWLAANAPQDVNTAA